MKLTKYGHACVFIENEAKEILVIDPGEWTEMPEDLGGIVAVVCTHVHGDHTDATNIQKIVTANPNVTIYANAESMATLSDVGCRKIEVDSDTDVNVSNYHIKMYALEHAAIWKTSPCKNLAVKVNDFYYYPGDSFYVIDEPVEVAGVPVSAPWLKMSEAIQFMYDVKAAQVMPTHNGLLNDIGHMLAHNWLKNTIGDTSKTLLLLKNNESYTTK